MKVNELGEKFASNCSPEFNSAVKVALCRLSPRSPWWSVNVEERPKTVTLSDFIVNSFSSVLKVDTLTPY